MSSNAGPPHPLHEVTFEIRERANTLDREAAGQRRAHQVYTVVTILLGVAAPALVTYSIHNPLWAVAAVVTTGFATAIGTIRTVLRFSERYSNSALTSIALLDLEAQVKAQEREVLVTVKSEFIDQKLYEVEAWARKQTFQIVKGYVEKEVLALTQDQLKLVPPPSIEKQQLVDPTKKA